jgi:hypothetical protein
LIDSQEITLGSNPNRSDTDGDGLLDGWEVAGVIPAFGISEAQAQPLPIPGVSPLRKDLFIEVDWMAASGAGGHTHQFREAAMQRVRDAFARAPVRNPSGEFGINIHIDAGSLGGGGDEIEHLPILAVGTDASRVPGVGDEGQGGAIAVGMIDADPRLDMVLMAYDAPSGPNEFRYRIAWNLDRDGNPTTLSGMPGVPWSTNIVAPGVGDEGQGAGARLIDLDGNSRPELVLMAYDNPSGPNSFRYRIGWNVSTSGIAVSWSDVIQIDGVGNEGQGAGLTFVNLDGDPRPELVLMAYDNPSGPNTFRYRVGFNVGTDGRTNTWSPTMIVGGVGNEGQGADVDVADLDRNGRPELILMAYDAPAGPNSYRYRIGWNLDGAGTTGDWQDGSVTYPGNGDEGQGAGLAVIDLDGVRTDLLLLAYDNPAGANEFRWNVAYNLDAAGNAVHYDYYKARFFNPIRASIYHYCIFAHDYWKGGSSSGLSFSDRDFIVTLGSWFGQTGTDNDQSGAFMHELGHNLGLGHGGDSGVNFKPNYPSIMNYLMTYTVDVDYDGVLDGALDYSHGWLEPLNENALDERAGTARMTRTEGAGNEGQGADVAFFDLDGNGRRDMVLLAYDAPSGPNNLRYKIGFDVTDRGVPLRWSAGYVQLPGMGNDGQGAGLEIVDLDGNGRPEMIVAVYDSPSGPNSIRYRIGWDLNQQGETSNWSRMFTVPGMGDEGQGLGLAIGQIDSDPRPDILVGVYDNPAGPNSFRYRVGFNIGPGGSVANWGGVEIVPGVGDDGEGMGVALANVGGGPRPELFLMAYDAPAGPNEFRLLVGFDLDQNGRTNSWRGMQAFPGLGNSGQGAGVRVLDINNNGRQDLFMLAYDNPSGPNEFRYQIAFDLNADATPTGPGYPRDWDNNGAITNPVQVNINGDVDGMGNPAFGTLTDFNDWANLKF